MTPDRLKTGAYGFISFTLRKKWRRKKYDTVETGFRLWGEIVENDDKHILVKDNDDMIYVVPKNQVREFIVERGGRKMQEV